MEHDNAQDRERSAALERAAELYNVRALSVADLAPPRADQGTVPCTEAAVPEAGPVWRRRRGDFRAGMCRGFVRDVSQRGLAGRRSRDFFAVFDW